MPRSANYYDNQINANKLSAPTNLPASSSPVNSPIDTSSSLPTNPNPDLMQNLKNQATLEENRNQALGISQAQLDSNIRKVLDKATYDEALTESNRSLASSLPYELANTVFDMPSQTEWETYSPWEKIKHIGVEVPKTAWKIIKAAPREIIKAPLRITQTLFDLEQRGLDKLTGYQPGKNAVLDAFRAKSSYELPVLGKVQSAGGSYDEGISMGLSPFASAVKATGEFAGDVAMSASLTEAVGAAFKPRIATLKSVTGEDFRPLQMKQVENIKEVKTAASANKITTAQPIQFGEATQNPDINYFRLPKSAAAKYGGNSDNTFLKLTPAGDGMAEFSVVQIRKSLFEKGKELFSSKFGKSNISEGEMGPELKLDSGTVKYDPSVLKPLPITAPGSTQGVDLATALKSIDGKISKIPTAEAYQFYSPNIEENLNFDEALKRMNSGNQLLYRKIGQDIDQQLGHQSQAIDALGDWGDGAENTVFNTIQKINNYDELKYSSALKGKIGQQKAVIPFMVSPSGPDQLFIADLKNTNLEEVRQKMSELGINFRTLAENKNGVKAIVFDPGSQLGDNLAKLGDAFDSEISVRKGQGEFLGNDTSRQAGVAEFDKIIKEYESRTGVTSYNPKLNQAPAPERQIVDPFTKARLSRKNKSIALEKGMEPAPSLMAKPLKGFENSVVTSKQADQILGIAADKEISDVGLQAIIKSVTGKNNLYDLSQTEAYNVSETVRNFADAENMPESDSSILLRSWTHPARYWMETAERQLGYPAYSEVFLPLETAGRELKVYADRWQQKARQVFDKYAGKNFQEERRLINSYIEGNKQAIINNPSLSSTVKMDLTRIGDWLIDTYKDLFNLIGMKSSRFFGEYAPKIRKAGSITNLYKTSEMPKEIKPFFEFEREGQLNPLEDDALALFDIYTKAIGKKQLMAEPLKNATKVMAKMPEGLQKAVNDYVQEKMGYQDSWSKFMNDMSRKLSKNTGGLLPEDSLKQTFDYLMTTSYAGALGLPRIMPLLRNAIQPLITTYPDLGPTWFAKGVKEYLKPGAVQELKDNGFLVEMGVPYGAELSQESSKSLTGKVLDYYKEINKKSMQPYANIDNMGRGVTYFGVKARFTDAWSKFRDGKIDYNEFERQIDMAGFNPTMRKVLQNKFIENTPKSLEDAQNMMIQDILDRTQFPYRKGSESRLHYGLRGKLGLQFSQWAWEYAFTLTKWASRGQWDKIVRWLGVSAAIKKSIEESTNVDVADWAAFGPFTGFPVGPIGKAASSLISGVNAAFLGMDDEVNKNFKDVTNALKIYGGLLSGVGVQKINQFWQSVKRYEAGVAVSTDPDPEKKFGVWSTNGKLIRWVSFSELLQNLMGFKSISGREQSDRIALAKKQTVEYQAKLDKAMNYLVDGKYDKFDQAVIKDNLVIADITSKLQSYNIPLDQRIFERMPMGLKEKYFTAFYPNQ